jgi:hypothetical protein
MERNGINYLLLSGEVGFKERLGITAFTIFINDTLQMPSLKITSGWYPGKVK